MIDRIELKASFQDTQRRIKEDPVLAERTAAAQAGTLLYLADYRAISPRNKAETPDMRVVALTTFDDAETVRRAMEAGCNGFLLKVIAPEKLRSSLLSIAGGMNVYDDEAMSHLKMNLSQRPEVDFTPRELEMLGYVSRGMTNAEIADMLNLRPGTVKNMISLLLNKTGCISRAQLARYAADNRLTD